VIGAGKRALDEFGAGTGSVRFICGTFTIHRELEAVLAKLVGCAASLTYVSCWNANEGLCPTLLREDDIVISDQLNHASIIDGIRLCKARRLRYANGDMDELEARLAEAADARYRLIATDGVFSMDGYLAQLDRICELAERHDALVMVDDSHAVGVVGPGGRGTPEHHGVIERVDIVTGTLGKAIGGASGGYVSARREIVELLRQRSRPYLFSNSVAPPVVAASVRALELIETSAELRDRLRDNTSHFRARLEELDFDVLPGEHPIVPVMIGDEVAAAAFSARLVDLGVYAVSFSFPVVPRGTARIRTQMSAAHSIEDLDFAAEQFAAARTDS
jgi:glycine C-acetyltransferase